MHKSGPFLEVHPAGPVRSSRAARESRGEDVVEGRISVHDFLATVYRHLQIDPRGIEFPDFAGRPIPILNQGTPIPGLVAKRS